MNEPRRILVVETLYLGDLIHTLPLVQALRQRFPAARIDLLVRAAHVPLMRCVDGVDEVLAYDPRAHRGAGGLLRLIATLRARGYELALNAGASDRAGWITAACGAATRLGRVNRRGQRLLARLLHDEVFDHPWGAEPMYWQKLGVFAARLELSSQVRFGLRPPMLDAAALKLPPRYIHLSPFASEDIRSLPPATVVELASRLAMALPECPLVVSCGPSPREATRLASVAPTLSELGVIVLAGRLELPQLASVIAAAALHIGPDSGPLHLARALDTPVVACFLFKDGSAEWLPGGPGDAVVGTSVRHAGGLYGLPIEAMVEAAQRQLT